jgi:hypothetical protein
MKPQTDGKSVTFQVRAWWEPKDNKIHLAGTGARTFILTVNNNPSNMRGHPKLFRELTKILKEAGAPAPHTPIL